jgi:hypothetical protein
LPGAQAAVHVVAEPSLKRPAEQFWHMLDVPSMKNWALPQQVLVPLVMHRLTPLLHDPVHDVHAAKLAPPAALNNPAGQVLHAVAAPLTE